MAKNWIGSVNFDVFGVFLGDIFFVVSSWNSKQPEFFNGHLANLNNHFPFLMIWGNPSSPENRYKKTHLKIVGLGFELKRKGTFIRKNLWISLVDDFCSKKYLYV